MIAWISLALAIDVCPEDQPDAVQGCVSLTEALQLAPRDTTTVFQMVGGVYRGPATIEGGRTIVIDGEDDVTFAASASDPQMEGRVAQFEVVDGTLDIRRVTLAPVNMGAIAAWDADGVLLRDAAIAPSGAGWGLLLEATPAQIDDSLFVGGLAFDGPHVRADEAVVDISGGDFIDGVASQRGGSLAFGPGSVVRIVGTRFDGNEAPDGGAISLIDATVALEGVTFRGNRANNRGGAVRADAGSAVRVEASEFEANVADSGGALHLDASRCELRVSTFCKNEAESYGGAVYAHDADSPLFTNVRFLDNVGRWGGALHLDTEGALIGNASFLGNRATEQGAAIYAPVGAEVAVHESVFAYSFGALAVSVSNEVSTSGAVTLRNIVNHENVVGNSSELVLKEDVFEADPLFRGYTPGQACGLVNDQHAIESALKENADELPHSGPQATCTDASGTGVIPDESPDWGAYGGPCGFPSTAWADEDGDLYAALYDCDDGDPDVNPGAEEIYQDGIDQNCDRANDFDEDEDGFNAGPDDCDDKAANRNRFIDDVDPFVDQDCDGQIEEAPVQFERERITCSSAGVTPDFGLGFLARRR